MTNNKQNLITVIARSDSDAAIPPLKTDRINCIRCTWTRSEISSCSLVAATIRCYIYVAWTGACPYLSIVEGLFMQMTRVIEKLSSIGGVISGISILLMAGLILVEIILRSVTGISVLVCEEYSAYLLVVFGSMALAYTFKSEGHIRVDLILSKLSPRNKQVINLFCTVIAFFVFVYMAFQSWGQFYGSWLSGESSMHFSKTPLWAPQVFIFAGAVLMVLQLLSTAAALFRGLAKTSEDGPEREKSSQDPG